MTGKPPAFDAAIPSSRLALPSTPHVPGTGSEPDWPPLEAAKALVPALTSDADWVDNTAYLYGFALLRGGCYWEAHEVWEPIWLASPPNGRARTLLRALIQTANARLKLKMNRPRAVVRLAEEARRELDGLGVADDEAFMGVVVSQLRADLDALAGTHSGDAEAAGEPNSGDSTERAPAAKIEI